jgi:hypothetical protein
LGSSSLSPDEEPKHITPHSPPIYRPASPRPINLPNSPSASVQLFSISPSYRPGLAFEEGGKFIFGRRLFWPTRIQPRHESNPDKNPTSTRMQPRQESNPDTNPTSTRIQPRQESDKDLTRTRQKPAGRCLRFQRHDDGTARRQWRAGGRKLRADGGPTVSAP